MSSFVLVDTNIWHFALVRPREGEYEPVHRMARSFLSSIMADQNVRVAQSSYQTAEVLEVLRKSGVGVEARSSLLEDFTKGKFFVKELSFLTVQVAARDSSTSNIHIYDYLVAYPLRGIVTRIYSADAHFTHPHFRELAEVVNPLSPWLLVEGKRPTHSD